MGSGTKAPAPGFDRRTPASPGMKRYFFLAVVLLTSVPGVKPHTAVTINSVGLVILPSTSVASGTNVSLNCTVDISVLGSQPLLFQYKLLKNDEVVYSKNHTEQTLFYPIVGARASHSGRYKCSVTVESKSQDSQTKRLNISGLQKPTLTLSAQTVMEGQEVLAECSAPKETGSFIFYFHKGSSESMQSHATTNRAEKKIVFHPGERSAVIYCNFRIMTLPEAGESDRSNAVNVTIRELLKEPLFVIKPSEHIIEGDSLEAECSAYPQSSADTQILLKKGANILNVTRGRVTYSWTPRAEDAGEYVCVAELSLVKKETAKTVSVQELFSRPVLTPQPQEVNEGESFNLTCRSTSITKERISADDVKYSIYKGSQLLSPEHVNGVYSKKGATLEDGESYFCNASAKNITKSSEVMHFKVYALVSNPTIRVTDDVILGKDFKIECFSEWGTLPISYTLLKAHETINTTVQRHSRDRALFPVRIKRKEEIAEFKCEAQNRGPHSVKQSGMLNVQVIEPVSAAVLTALPNIVEGTNTSLSCAVQSGTPPITFKWYQTGNRKPLHTNFSTNNVGIYTFRASRDQSGTYYCTATNRALETKYSNQTAISVNLAEWKTTVIAVVTVLMLVCVAGFCVLWFRSRKAKKERDAELSVKPSSPTADEPLAVSLTNETEVYNAHKAGPEAEGGDASSSLVEKRSEPGSEVEGCADTPSEPDVEYTEVMHRDPDPSRAPVRKGTDTVYSELRTSASGEPEPADCDSVEYAQLNHNNAHPRA
ncbi:platelet endothelial cell adhesion molecule-like isoform X1 [Lepisosteus oculatus]|uniref:platelet endothelial cell adhesion molecule-like isoform X1 n=1 Tax=Lepisosteus oculatus TaxID=7918 RepID=UPI00073FBB1F|nr:PREDICTED: platelet endothelial cell adhesion molecule-like isoform X1 [Lepisosteus oculatus]